MSTSSPFGFRRLQLVLPFVDFADGPLLLHIQRFALPFEWIENVGSGIELLLDATTDLFSRANAASHCSSLASPISGP
jgi:hypothetical protein